MEKRIMTFVACLFLSIGMALAQSRVSGKVTSSEDGQPVIGATVKVVGHKNAGAVTDIDGNFTLDVPAGATLEISYIGMTSKTVKAASKMNIVLENNSKDLDEVVVVGYGSARKISSLTGTVATVNSDKLKNAPSASVLDNLQGQVSGLSVLSSSGEAGDNAVSMKLHGTGSLGAGSTPLYVLDGIPTTSRTVMAMNPNDIKSVTVLKDASATSIYGSRAANGVIYVTTKNGSYNSKATITVRSQYGWNTLANKGFYEDMMSGDELYNFWLNAGLASAETLKKRYDDNGYRTNTKWYNIYQQFNTPQTQNDLDIQGGSELMSYNISASQFHQKGTTIGNYYDRYTFRTNLNARPKTWLRTGVNINLSYDKTRRNSAWGNSSGNTNYTNGGLSFLLNPLYPSKDPETGEDLIFYPFGVYNPQYMADNSGVVTSRYFLNGNTFFEIEPVKNLKLRSRIGTDIIFTRANGFMYPSYIPANGSGSRSKSSGYQYTHTITNTIEYAFDINRDHHFTVLAGQEGIETSFDSFAASSEGQLVDGLLNLQDGKQSTFSVSESSSLSRFLSFFGRADYNYNNRYFFDFTLRNDACSRFGKNNRNATFWAAGAMWKVKSEEFMKPYTWINALDLKVSYGTQGNASIGDYASLGLYGGVTRLNDEYATSYQQPANPNLTWETQKLLTVGVSGRLWNRFDFDLAYYLRKTSDMLMDVPYPITSGFPSIYSNVGELQNQGIDVKLGVDIVRGADYYVNFSTVFNYNAEKITKLFDNRQRWEIAGTVTAYVVGKARMFYLPLYAGVNKETGAPMWYKAGDNPDVTTKGETTENYDEAALTQNSGKKVSAPVNGGFSLSAGWKGISLQADFSYVLGKYLANNDALFYDNPNVVGTSYNQRKDVNDFWSEENPNAKYPKWSDGHQMQFDDHLLENASFMRLKNLQIGYQLPKSILAWQNVLNGVKFTFTGRNLFTITNYKGLDPEVAGNLTAGRIGNSKQFLFGMELTF